MTRRVIAGGYPGRIVPKGARVSHSSSTSGTTGTPLRILHGPGFTDTRMGLAFRRTWVDGVRPWHRGIVVWSGEGLRDVSQASIFDGSMGLAKRLILGGGDSRILVARQLNFFVARGEWKTGAGVVSRFRPDVIYARPSQLRRLGLALEDAGKTPKLTAALTSGEFLSRGVRTDLETLFRCSVFDSYGSNELGGLGFECPEQCGTHLNADCFAFEVMKDGERVSPGESGDIVVTGLHDQTMPLVRYEQGDRVVAEPEERCGCGSFLPRLREIQGRLSDGIVTSSGSRVPPGEICNYLESVLEMRDFQLIQKRYDRVKLKAPKNYLSTANVMKIANFLGGLLGCDVDVETLEWREEEMPVKYRPVTSEAD